MIGAWWMLLGFMVVSVAGCVLCFERDEFAFRVFVALLFATCLAIFALYADQEGLLPVREVRTHEFQTLREED